MSELTKASLAESSPETKQPLQLSSYEYKRLGAVATKGIDISTPPEITYLERVSEAEKLSRKNTRVAIEDYILASQFLSEVTNGTVANYLDKKEFQCLTNIDQFIEHYTRANPGKEIASSDVLRSAFKSMVTRRNNSTPPQNPIGRDKLKDFRHELKTNYILGLGEKLKDYIDLGKMKNVGEAKGQIRTLFSEAFLRQRGALEPAGLYKDTTFQQEKIRDIENLFNGMRHELAFEEMIYEGNADEFDNLFEIEETGRAEELQGIDMRLIAKVIQDANGVYTFPSTEEEFNACTGLARIDLDIKASEKAVADALRQRQKSGHDKDPNQSLIMWSHVYNDDFRLDMADGLPNLGYTPDEALLYFKTGENSQLSAMRQLDRSPSLTYRLPGGNLIHPDNFKQRYLDIKKQLIDYVNANPDVVKLNGI